MAKILFGWELGTGHGHVARLLAVARGLAAAGHQPIFAVRNLVEPAALFDGCSFPVFQAPVWLGDTRIGRSSFSAAALSDIFYTQGFGDPDELTPMVEAWQALIDTVAPDLIVSDYAPTLCLAAFGAHPMVVVGDGFTVPPGKTPEFPLLRPHEPVTITQRRMVQVIAEVQRRRGRPAPESLPELFAAEARFVCCLPELDPYREDRLEPVLGPFQPLPEPCPLPEARHYFAYLAADAPSMGRARAGLPEVTYEGAIFIRSAPRGLKEYFRGAGIEVFDKPAPIRQVVREARAVVHHGGIGTTEVALGIGRPQVLLPRHLEQNLTARSLEALGLAVGLSGKFEPRTLARAVEQVLQEPAYGAQAQAFAQELQARGPVDNVARIVEGSREILARLGAA